MQGRDGVLIIFYKLNTLHLHCSMHVVMHCSTPRFAKRERFSRAICSNCRAEEFPEDDSGTVLIGRKVAKETLGKFSFDADGDSGVCVMM